MGHASVRQGAVRCEQSEDCNGFLRASKALLLRWHALHQRAARCCYIQCALSFPPAAAPPLPGTFSLHLTVPPCRRNPFLHAAAFLSTST